MPATLSHDVVVVGGGVVGLTTAALFARDGARVAIVEPSLDDRMPSGPIELRNYAISPAGRRALELAGAWSAIDRSRIGEFDAVSVRDAGSSGAISFMPPPSQGLVMGWIVEHQNLIGALATTLAKAAVTFVNGPVTALDCGPSALLTLADGTRMAARLVVGADGSHSFVRTAADISFKRERYDHRAIVANVVTELPHHRIARQRFLATGPLAFLPLGDLHQSSIVWSCTSALASSLECADDATFSAELGAAFDLQLGRVRSTTERAIFTLERAKASAWVCGACALVGDAAHIVHPLAGQGLNLGLMDGAALLECVGPVVADASWPRPAALRRYERWRKSEALALTVVTDGLKRLFAREERAFRMARGLGMHATDSVASLKNWLSVRALGSAGDVPEILSTARAES